MKKNTILDIAKLAGVSKSTVSRVINNESGVKEETKIKVLKVIKENNFSPSKSARELRGIKVKTYGILVTRLDSNSESQVVRGITKELYKNNCDYLILENQFSIEKTRHFVDTLMKRDVDGFIVFAIANEKYDFLKETGKKVVLIGQDVEGFNCIVYDDYNAVKMVLEHLWKIGKRKIAYVGVNRNDPTTGEKRYKAYEDFAGLKKMKNISGFGNFEYYSGYEVAEGIIKHDIDAIVCGTDNLALGVKEYLRRKNIDNTVVTGIGNNNLLRFLDSNHISISFSYEKSGEKAVQTVTDIKNTKVNTYTYKAELILNNVLDKS